MAAEERCYVVLPTCKKSQILPLSPIQKCSIFLVFFVAAVAMQAASPADLKSL